MGRGAAYVYKRRPEQASVNSRVGAVRRKMKIRTSGV